MMSISAPTQAGPAEEGGLAELAQARMLGSAKGAKGKLPAGGANAVGELQLHDAKDVAGAKEAQEAKQSADKATSPRVKRQSFEGVLAQAMAPPPPAPVKAKEPAPGKPAAAVPQAIAVALKASTEALSSWKPHAPTVDAAGTEAGEARKAARTPLRPKVKDDAPEPTPVAAAAPSAHFEVKLIAPVEAPREAAPLPANFLPADARADAALRVAVNSNNARAQISTAQGPLAIELFLKNGAADIHLRGALGPQLAAHQSDMRLALVANGLRLATLQGVRTLPSEGASVRSDARGSDTPPEGDTP
jgi:hypothetical protein